jgi:hypothetical protein
VYDDARLWDALKRTYLVDSVGSETSIDKVSEKSLRSGRFTLDMHIQDEGSNLSVGEVSLMVPLQLHQLMRSILAVLGQSSSCTCEGYSHYCNGRSDRWERSTCLRYELTYLIAASVDYETDRNIQATIQSEFKNKTLLCIAHRLQTIIGYDRICVIDSGKVVEFDTPARLFQQQDGIFRGMCRRSGISLLDVESASRG